MAKFNFSDLGFWMKVLVVFGFVSLAFTFLTLVIAFINLFV